MINNKVEEYLTEKLIYKSNCYKSIITQNVTRLGLIFYIFIKTVKIQQTVNVRFLTNKHIAEIIAFAYMLLRIYKTSS